MRQWTVDAFASGPFKGNPACVLEPFDAWPDDAWMQALAAENNQAETAYLLNSGDPARFGLRWFTPAVEVPLCGHATLASAHVLLRELFPSLAAVVFETRSGALGVRAVGEALEMDFPADPPRRVDIPDGLEAALGVRPLEAWAGAYLVAVLADEAAVRALRPDLAAIARIGAEATGGRGNLSVASVGRQDRTMTWSAGSSPPARAFSRIRRQGRPIASWRPCSPASSGARPCGSTRPIRGAAATSRRN